jgi:hypothetical protein
VSPCRTDSLIPLNASSRAFAAAWILVAALSAAPPVGAESADTEGTDSNETAAVGDRQAEAAVDRDSKESGSRYGAAPPPAGVRFAEALEDERLRIGYSWERLRGQGMMAGDNRVSTEYVRATPPLGLGYTQNPRSLEVTVHTVQVAYAPHPRVTLIAEVPFLQKELETVDAAGLRSEKQTEGVGDVGFAILVPFIRKGTQSTQVHIGFDAPTGAYRRGGDDMRLPYDSQIGNGTWDFEWGWTYRGSHKRWSWGGQAIGRHPMSRNGVNYREGSRFWGTLWTGVRVFSGVSTSLRMEWRKQNNIEGFDRTLRPGFDPSENHKARGGERITVSPGLSLDIPQLNGQRISIEAGIPVYQRLDGPQLKQNWTLKTAWQWVF